MHVPPEHAGDAFAGAEVHATGEPHAPPAAHVSTPEPEHVVCEGAHTPEQAPLAHVWFTHAEAALQAPFDWHDSTPLPEHVV